MKPFWSDSYCDLALKLLCPVHRVVPLVVILFFFQWFALRNTSVILSWKHFLSIECNSWNHLPGMENDNTKDKLFCYL